MSDIDFLRKIIGAAHDEELLQKLRCRVVLKKYFKGQLVYSGVTKNFFCVATGTVKSYKITDDGMEVFSDVFSQGNFFGNLLCTNASEYARVTSDYAEIYTLKSSDLLEVLDRSILLTIMLELEDRIYQAENYFLRLMSLGIKDRLIFFLENLAKKRGYQNGSSITIECPLTAAEIAGSIFATRQSVSSYLKELKKTSWLKANRKEIELRGTSFERYIRAHSVQQLHAA